MRELDEYEDAWSLDTDSFIQGPITYDVFGAMAAANATYGYMDVNVETASVAEARRENAPPSLPLHAGFRKKTRAVRSFHDRFHAD